MTTPWRCVRDGSCCRESDEVVVTHAERVELERASTLRTLRFLPHADPRFVRLQAKPCPLYDAAQGCTVYAVRPYNCRRMACGRHDVTTEPFVNEHPPARFYTDRAFRRQMVLMQRRSQPWARKMGWSAECGTG